MKQLVMVILMIGGIGCAVEPASTESTSSTAAELGDESADPSAASSSNLDESPHFVQQCQVGICEFRTDCLAQGGRALAPCGPVGVACCLLP